MNGIFLSTQIKCNEKNNKICWCLFQDWEMTLVKLINYCTEFAQNKFESISRKGRVVVITSKKIWPKNEIRPIKTTPNKI